MELLQEGLRGARARERGCEGAARARRVAPKV